MPATAGRVRMPANNRVHSSAALQTHGIWQSAIGYDPYAPDQKQSTSSAAVTGTARTADQQNTYDSFQGLLALARLTGSNADEARGSCRKCGRVGHLAFQCRNMLAIKEAAAASPVLAPSGAAACFADRETGLTHRKDRNGEIKARDAKFALDNTPPTVDDEDSEDDDSDVSDSSEDSDMERLILEKFGGRNPLKSSSHKSKLIGKDSTRRKKSVSRKRRSRKDTSEDDSGSSEEEHKRSKHRSKSKKRRADDDYSSEEDARKHRSKHKKRKENNSAEEEKKKSKHRSKSGKSHHRHASHSESDISITSESEGERKKRRRKHSRKHTR